MVLVYVTINISHIKTSQVTNSYIKGHDPKKYSQTLNLKRNISLKPKIFTTRLSRKIKKLNL